MLNSTLKNFFYIVTVTIIIIIVSFVITFSKQHKYRSESFQQQLIDIPKSEKALVYNVYTKRNLCEVKTFDELPEFSFVSETSPTKSHVDDESIKTLKTSLKIHDSGKLLYFVNGVLVWTSEKPRSYITNAQSILVKNYSDLKSIEDWTFASETSNSTRLHLNPLAITKLDSLGNRKLLWSFLSGWDPSSVSDEGSKAVIPIPFKKNDSGIYFLISENRKKRLALCSNGDLITIECGGLKTKDEFSTSFFSSLMMSYC
jgi:hypothetical protein